MALLSHKIEVRQSAFGPHTIIKPRSTTPIPTVRPFFGSKAKKALFYKLLTGSASVWLALIPSTAGAATIPFISNLLGSAISISSASSPSYNSQTFPVLSPALNLDPHPSIGGGDITVVADSALLPQTGPAGTAADIQNEPTSSLISIYTVRSGDTLSSIAHMFNVSVNTIAWANDITDGTVQLGERLIILPVTGVRHSVQKGDTLASLAKKYNSDVHEIALYNDLSDDAVLSVSDTIIVPDGETAAPKPPVKTVAKASTKTTTKVTVKSPKGFVPAKLRGVGGPDEGSYYSWPVNGGIITQSLHGFDAVDIGAPKGTAIYASAGGVVIVAKTGGWNGGYGSYVVIAHGNGTQTLYGHMSKVEVKSGDSVTSGEEIGLVGATGEATGFHLHFEIRGAKNPFGSIPVGSSGN